LSRAVRGPKFGHAITLRAPLATLLPKTVIRAARGDGSGRGGGGAPPPPQSHSDPLPPPLLPLPTHTPVTPSSPHPAATLDKAGDAPPPGAAGQSGLDAGP
jgi:hypothetical protein